MKELKKVLKISCLVLIMILSLCSCGPKNGVAKDNTLTTNKMNNSNKQLLLKGTQEAINAKYKNVIKKYYGMDELKVFQKYFSNLVIKQEDIDDETSLLCIAYYLYEVNIRRRNSITNEGANICIYKLIERGDLTFPNKAFKELEWDVFFVGYYKKYENEFNEGIAKFKKLGIDEINNRINKAKEKVNDEIYYDGLRNQY